MARWTRGATDRLRVSLRVGWRRKAVVKAVEPANLRPKAAGSAK